MEEAVDRFDDHAPLGEPGDDTQSVEAGFELVRQPDAELRIVLHLFSITCASGRSAYTSAIRLSLSRQSSRSVRHTHGDCANGIPASSLQTGVEVASFARVSELNTPQPDRRIPNGDRRKHSRSGR